MENTPATNIPIILQIYVDLDQIELIELAGGSPGAFLKNLEIGLKNNLLWMRFIL